MGKQVRFFNFPADVVELDEVIAESHAVIIHDRAPTADPVTASTLRPEGNAPGRLLIVRPGDLPNLRWHHVPTHGCWSIDQVSSPVVEYTPGYTRDGEPKFVSPRAGHGRMWIGTTYLVENQLVSASPDFVAWADRLFRWVKKHWLLIESDYYSPAAAELWHDTWQVVFDEPCEATGSDQISRWRRQNDPMNALPPDALHIAISRATRQQPRRLTISLRAPAR